MLWIENLGKKLSSYFTGTYVNYIDSSLSNWQQAYYGKHYAKWNPINFFNFK